MESYVELRHISKSFGRVKALDDASLSCSQGEVLAIVGDNGAGKSTLIKILTGEFQPDSGEIRIGGRSFTHLTIRQALAEGISCVYQDLALGDTLNVAQNIFLGKELTRHGLLLRKEMERESAALLERLKIDIPDPRVPVAALSGGQRQGVAVARLVNRGGSILIFDEPTAAMGLTEAGRTLALLRELADQGLTVIIICHNLAQVYQIADRIAVMRHGKVMREDQASKISQQDIVAILSSALLDETEGGKHAETL